MPAVLPFLSVIWGSTLGRLIAIGVAAFLVGWVKGWSAVPRVDVKEVQRLAWEQRDAEWTRKLTEKEREHETAMASAIEARDSGAPLTADADLRKLCGSSKTCRDQAERRQ